jgi:oxygen-independent coproporphyrinogen-3 oxidase
MAHLRKHFNLLDDDSGDYGIEIDPREADWSTMGLLRELGFNRVSIGVQDLDPAVQRAVNRLQSLEETRAVIDAARTLQFRSINIDLIYGLPKQTPEGFARTVEKSSACNRTACRCSTTRTCPSVSCRSGGSTATTCRPRAKLQMLQRTIEQLTAAGYRYIGMDHFALPDDELAIAQEEGTLQRNFQGYTTHGHCDLIGLGVSAISQIGDLYCQNSSDLNTYQNTLPPHNWPPARPAVQCRRSPAPRGDPATDLQFQPGLRADRTAFNIDFRATSANCGRNCRPWPTTA